MYIEPNGQVKLMHTGLPSDYTDTIYFDSVTDQYNYFANLAGTWLNAQSYTRVNRGIFRCSLPMRETYNVDYMMFRNQAFENKWFYAFVTHVDYVNNGMCEVNFAIDTIQTWFIGTEAALGQCFVKRETVANDAIGANLTAENLALGEYVAERNTLTYLQHDLLLPVIVVAINDVAGVTEGVVYDNTYSGCQIYAFDTTENDIEALNSLITSYTNQGKPDAIVGIWMAPKLSLPLNRIPSDHKIVSGNPNIGTTSTEQKITSDSGFNGYKPKNNKLYTYPYNFCRVMTGQGNKADYRYEYFSDLTPTFEIVANLLTPVSAFCSPIDYKNHYISSSGQTKTADPIFNESVSLNSYPMCSWNYDTYAAWVAQNSVPMANTRNAWREKALLSGATQGIGTLMNTLGGMAGGAITAGLGALSLNPVIAFGGAVKGASQIIGAGMGGINNSLQQLSNTVGSKIDLVTEQMNADYSASIEADTMGGTINSGNSAFAHGDMQFYFERWHVDDMHVKSIDDYFSMFGYAINRVKTPNITSRPHWNYIQTVDANIKGDMPADDRNAIKTILDNGVRFWKNGSEIGNYDLDNSPLQA